MRSALHLHCASLHSSAAAGGPAALPILRRRVVMDAKRINHHLTNSSDQTLWRPSQPVRPILRLITKHGSNRIRQHIMKLFRYLSIIPQSMIEEAILPTHAGTPGGVSLPGLQGLGKPKLAMKAEDRMPMVWHDQK